jgi:hypothetical protein
MNRLRMITVFMLSFAFMFCLTDSSFSQTKKKKKTTKETKIEEVKEAIPVTKESSLVINRFVSDPNLETHLVVTDAEGIGVKIRIQIYDEDGKMKYDKYEILNPFGKINIDPHGCINGEKMTGSIRVFSEEGRIVGQYWQFYKTKELGYKNTAIAAADGKGFTKILCQHFVSDPAIETYIVVSNVEKDKPAVVNIKYYDNNGAIISVQRKVIQPNGCISAEPYKDTNVKTTGVAVVDSEMGIRITGEYWQHSAGEKYQVALPMEGITRYRQ